MSFWKAVKRCLRIKRAGEALHKVDKNFAVTLAVTLLPGGVLALILLGVAVIGFVVPYDIAQDQVFLEWGYLHVDYPSLRLFGIAAGSLTLIYAIFVYFGATAMQNNELDQFEPIIIDPPYIIFERLDGQKRHAFKVDLDQSAILKNADLNHRGRAISFELAGTMGHRIELDKVPDSVWASSTAKRL